MNCCVKMRVVGRQMPAEESGANLRLWAVQTDIIVTSAIIGLPKLSVAIYIQQIIFTPRGEEKLVRKLHVSWTYAQ